jgi:hypothetical protein
MWIFDFHEVKKETPGVKTSFGRKVLYAIAAFMVVVGAFILVAGMYGTVLGINTAFAEGTVGSPFSCAGELPSISPAFKIIASCCADLPVFAFSR